MLSICSRFHAKKTRSNVLSTVCMCDKIATSVCQHFMGLAWAHYFRLVLVLCSAVKTRKWLFFFLRTKETRWRRRVSSFLAVKCGHKRVACNQDNWHMLTPVVELIRKLKREHRKRVRHFVLWATHKGALCVFLCEVLSSRVYIFCKKRPWCSA